MTDHTTHPPPPHFWRTLFSVPNAVALAFFLTGVGGWVAGERDFREHMEERVRHIETRMDAIEAADAMTYVRRDVLTEQLNQVQKDVTALREEVREVKQEVKKIR